MGDNGIPHMHFLHQHQDMQYNAYDQLTKIKNISSQVPDKRDGLFLQIIRNAFKLMKSYVMSLHSISKRAIFFI